MAKLINDLNKEEINEPVPAIPVNKPKKPFIKIGIIAAAAVLVIVVGAVLVTSNQGTDMEKLQKKAAKQDEAIQYNAEEDAVEINYDGNESEFANRMYVINDCMKDNLDTLRLHINDVRYTESGQLISSDQAGDIPFNYVNDLKCENIELIDDFFTYHVSAESAGDLAKVSTLTMKAKAGDFVELPALKELTLVHTDSSHSVNYANLLNLKNLEKLTIRITQHYAYSDVNESAYKIPELKNLKYFSFDVLSKEEREQNSGNQTIDAEAISNENVDMAIACQQAALAPSIQEINGSKNYNPKDELSDEEYARFQSINMEIFCRKVFNKYENGEYPSGGEKAAGKAVVYFQSLTSTTSKMQNSYSEEATGDYMGISGDKLTKEPEECKRMILIYPQKNRVGMYTNGASAYETETTVVDINLETGKVVSKEVVATNQPPQIVYGLNSGNGKFEPDKAEEVIKNLLK